MSCWRSWTWEEERKIIIKRLLIRCRDPLKRSCFYDEDLVSISEGKSNKQTRESKSLNDSAWTWGVEQEGRSARRDATRVARPLRSHKTAIVRVCDETDEKDDVSSWSSDFFILIHLCHPQSYVYFSLDYHPSTWLHSVASGYTIHPYCPNICIFWVSSIHTAQKFVCNFWVHYHPST